MSTFKVQRIRSCVQCGDVLSLKCKGCVKHPDRKPRVIEYYDWPEILKTAECGCCIYIQCQFPGCGKCVWRNKSHNREGRAISKAFFCSTTCSGRTIGLARVNRREVPCAYCAKKVMKKACELKTWKHAFCNRTCYFLFKAKQTHDQKQIAEKLYKSLNDLSMLQCQGKCRGQVTEHSKTSKNTSACKTCNTVRDDRVMTTSASV